jgi:uncharacterized protein (UPF0332 family)
MSFRWQEYLTLAKLLGKVSEADPLREAKLRCAISRSYYAAFKTAQVSLEGEGHWFPETREAHRKVQEILKNSGRRKAARNLQRLSNLRNDADYRSEVRIAYPMAERAIEVAAQIIQSLNNPLP